MCVPFKNRPWRLLLIRVFQAPAGLCPRGPMGLAVRRLPAPSVADGWDDPPQHENAGDSLVWGRLLDHHRQARDLGAVAVIPDFKAITLKTFITQHVSPGSTVYTDGLKQFTGLPDAGYDHVPRTQPDRADLRKGVKIGRPPGRPRDRHPAAVADRDLPWRAPSAAPSVSRRVCVSAQSTSTTHGGVPDPARPSLALDAVRRPTAVYEAGQMCWIMPDRNILGCAETTG